VAIKKRTSNLWRHFFPDKASETDYEANVNQWLAYVSSRVVDQNATVDDCLLLSIALSHKIDIVIIETSEPPRVYSIRSKYKDVPILQAYFTEPWSKYSACFLSFVDWRPLYFSEDHTSEYLRQRGVFYPLIDYEKALPMGSISRSFEYTISPGQPYPPAALQASTVGIAKNFLVLKKGKVIYTATGYVKERKTRMKKSSVWKYFKEVEEGSTGKEFHCNVAGCDTKYRGTTASDNLKSHLYNVHRISIDATHEDKDKKLMITAYARKRQHSADPPVMNSNVLESMVMYACLMNGSNTADAPWFREIIYTALACAPTTKLRLPSRSTIFKALDSRVSQFDEFRIAHWESNESYYSLTFDGWTDKHMRAFFVITIHWIDESYVMHTTCLDIAQVPGGDDVSIRLANKIRELLLHYRLTGNDFCRIFATTTDNASEPMKCQKEISASRKTRHILNTRCGGHILALGLKALWTSIEPLTTKVTALVIAIRGSKTKREAFRSTAVKLLGKVREPPCIPSGAKWLSEFLELNAVLELEAVFRQVCTDIRELEELQLYSKDWRTIQILTNILSQFAQIKDKLEPSSRPTIHQLQVLISRAIHVCNNPQNYATDLEYMAHEDKRAIIEGLADMASKLEEYSAATDASDQPLFGSASQLGIFFDPRYKRSTRRKYEDLARDVLADVFGYKESVAPRTTTTSAQSSSIYDGFESEGDESEASEQSLVAIKHPVDKYLEMDLDCDISDTEESGKLTLLQWWKKVAIQFPKEFNLMVRSVLSVQASSCQSERLCSHSKHVLQGREKLSPDRFRNEMVMKQWTYTKIPCPLLDFTNQFAKDDDDVEDRPTKKRSTGSSAVIEVD
jgi:hypothetical protein